MPTENVRQARDGVNAIWPIPNPIPFDQFQIQFLLTHSNYNSTQLIFEQVQLQLRLANSRIGIYVWTIPIPELTLSLRQAEWML